MKPTASVIICGAGIAGIAAAHELSVTHGLDGVVLVDERPPLSLTSDKSTECYRNWWPDPAMVALMERSIDGLEALAAHTGNAIGLNRRGYLYATRDSARLDAFRRAAEAPSAHGAGPLRVHAGRPGETPYRPAPAHGFLDQPTGADLLLDPRLIRAHFPYLSEAVVAVLHARRGGWFSGQQLGAWLLREARAHGARLVEGRVTGVTVEGGRLAAVRVAQRGTEETWHTRTFVDAAGPFVGEVARLVGVELPVYSELHLKLNFRDERGVVPRDAPMVICADAQRLPWDDEERAWLAADDELRWLLDELPAGAHLRPDGGPDSPIVLMLWPYHTEPVPPRFPLPTDPLYPEIVLRGLCSLVPGLRVYLDRLAPPVVDGGYYTRTAENRPLVGPLPVEGAFVLGALSGFGLMAAPGAAALLAAHVTGGALPDDAPAFALARYDDPAYRQRVANWGDVGQL